jgi:NitT/TauT family transport system permease protein
MTTAPVTSSDPVPLSPAAPAPDSAAATPIVAAVPAARWSLRPFVVALPVLAATLALALHLGLPSRQSPEPTTLYPRLLIVVAGAAVLLALVQWLWPWFAARYRPRAPLLAVAILLVAAWDLITLKLALLPLPYFPHPELIIRSLLEDRSVLLESTYHSLVLLMSGYATGVILGLVSGVLIGWFPSVRYWAMPLLKVVGPIPATAWIPLALIVFPTSFQSSVALIAMAVWFPVTMLTSSGISAVRLSYLDVARTMGAGQGYLVFRVAIPSALPNIFLGLFMGLGASFLTLVVAEMLGVKAGLGWYVSWAQGWAEYGKVYAALVIIAAFFSTIMTLLFKVRDRLLVWQKGTIQW